MSSRSWPPHRWPCGRAVVRRRGPHEGGAVRAAPHRAACGRCGRADVRAVSPQTRAPSRLGGRRHCATHPARVLVGGRPRRQRPLRLLQPRRPCSGPGGCGAGQPGQTVAFYASYVPAQDRDLGRVNYVVADPDEDLPLGGAVARLLAIHPDYLLLTESQRRWVSSYATGLQDGCHRSSNASWPPATSGCRAAVVHRDLAPRRFPLSPQGSGPRPYRSDPALKGLL